MASLSALDPAARRRRIDEALEESLSRGTIEERLEGFERRAGWIDVWTAALFVHTFVTAPILCVQRGLIQVWPLLLVGFAGLWLPSVVSYVLAHRDLYPDRRTERWQRVISMTLLPLSVMRARNDIARRLFEGLDPIVTAATLAGSRARPLVHAALRELTYPLLDHGGTTQPLVEETLRDARASYLADLLPVLSGLGFELEQALAPPTPYRDTAAYCPRCRHQFRTATATCDDCGGRSLIRLAPEPRTPG